MLLVVGLLGERLVVALVIFEAVLAVPIDVPGLAVYGVEPTPYLLYGLAGVAGAFPAGDFSNVSTYPFRFSIVLLSSSMWLLKP